MGRPASLSKREQAFYVRMVQDAELICGKLQQGMELDEEDLRRLAALPEDVQREIVAVGALRPGGKRSAKR